MYRQKWFTVHVKPEHAIMRHTVVIMMFLRFLLLSCLYFRYSDGMFGVYICVYVPVFYLVYSLFGSVYKLPTALCRR